MSDLAYQNKDITLKLLTEALKHKRHGYRGNLLQAEGKS